MIVFPAWMTWSYAHVLPAKQLTLPFRKLLDLAVE
jgi:hypothetical protein